MTAQSWEGGIDWITTFEIAEDQGVAYGISPFRSLAVVQGGVYAGDEAGNLWKLEYEGESLRKA